MFSRPNYSELHHFLNPRLGPWTVDIYLHRKPILDAVHDSVPVLNGKLLDVGCGQKPYASILKCETHIGIDLASSPNNTGKFDLTFDGLHIPFNDSEFDSVLCTEVIEHSRNPLALMKEIARVLKSSGHALVTVPFFIHHHEEPFDYWRLTRYGMEQLASDANLDIVWLRARRGVYSTALAAFYLALQTTLSRRPLIDLILWVLWPVTFVVIKIENLRKRVPVITLGWQMLVRKR